MFTMRVNCCNIPSETTPNVGPKPFVNRTYLEVQKVKINAYILYSQKQIFTILPFLVKFVDKNLRKK